MDKIDFSRWDNYFGQTHACVLHASDRYTETVFTFEEKGLPGGEVKTVNTPGLTLTELHIHTSQPFMFVDTQQQEAAESLFLLKGDVESCFDAYDHPLQFSRHNQSIQYNPDFSGSHLIRSNEFHAFTISYDVDYLSELLESADTAPLRALMNCIQRKQNFLSSPYAMKVSGRIAEVIHAIQNCPFKGFTRYVFIESKLMELFVLQMEQLNTAQPGKWSRVDVEKLFAVKEFIETSYLEPLTLKELTVQFGLNEFKLKKGYKELFKTTVFGHVHYLRMQKAKSLLAEREMNVSEVAFYIGYENVSSFSTGFKKRFGYRPREGGLRL